MTTAPSPRRLARSAKGLSLNFPILPPVSDSAVPSPRARADTCPSPNLPSPTKSGSDILTLVAAQERRVLELREELAKAESELGGLKKKWAVYEANKKRDEFRHTRSMAVPLDEMTSPHAGLGGQVDIEEERRRRRALVERSTGAGHRHSLSVRAGRKTSPRVFQGSHTRALSLLSHQSHTPTQSLPETPTDESSAGGTATSQETATVPALDGFVPRPQSFGKTYKDLAAQRKPMSPPSADTLMKSGKLVVEGVRDGLWTFFEDIRLATVGDEAINGPPTGFQRRRSSKPQTRSSQESAGDARNALKTEPSFWSEFGVESPASRAGGERRPRARPGIRHGNKETTASTSSQNVPDLLDDTSEEEWEQWDSPVNDRLEDVTSTKGHTTGPAHLGDLPVPVPWPELDKVQPKGDGEALANGYQMLEELGSGSFGVVYKAIEKATGQIVAIKHVDLESSEEDLSDIISELAVLSSCTSSPYVTQYKRAFLRRQTLWIVMEYLGGGSCADLLKPPPHALSEAHIAIIVKELLHGLAYLHSEGKLHRDIKAANVLLGMDGRVKLADFGVAAQLVGLKSVRNTFVGTPFWMAPEVIQQEGHDVKADIWSLGITAIELATGEPPHANVHPMKVLFLIPKQPPPRLEGSQWSREFKDFVALCLTKESERRPTAKELLRHKFVRSAGKVEGLQELIQRKQEYDSSNGGDRNLKYYAETLRSFNHPAAAVQAEDDWVFDTVKAFSSRSVIGHGSRKKQRLSAVRVIDDERAQEEQQADAMEGLITEYPTATRKVSSTMNPVQHLNTRRRVPSSSQSKQPLGVNMSFGNSPSTVRQFRRVSPDAARNKSRENKPSEENQDPSPANSKPVIQSTPTKLNQVVVSNPFVLSTATTVASNKSDSSSSKEAVLGRQLYLKAIGMGCQEVLDTTAGETKRNAVAKLAEAWSDLEAIDPEGVLAKPPTNAAKLVLSQANPHLKSHRRRQSTQAVAGMPAN
ncbi:hypothetical protein DV735_g1468, partial [Chaetothyriales sp. CBS 134920]